MKHRIIATISFEVEGLDQEHAKAVQEAEAKVDELLEQVNGVRRRLKIERLRDRVHNVRLAVFKPEDVLPYICAGKETRDYIVGNKTYSIRMNSQRYVVFQKSLRCAACGLQGTQMILEQNPQDSSPHFNLYGEENGKLVLFTKDHIVPRSAGGPSTGGNYQTMCSVCNNLKGHMKLSLKAVAELRKIYNNNQALSKKKLSSMLRDTKKMLILMPDEMQLPLRIVASEDINVWKMSSGGLLGRPVDQKLQAELVASVKKGTELIPISEDITQVLVKLSDTENFLVYRGCLEHQGHVVVEDQAVS